MCDQCNKNVPTNNYRIGGMVFKFCSERCKYDFKATLDIMIGKLTDEVKSWKVRAA